MMGASGLRPSSTVAVDFPIPILSRAKALVAIRKGPGAPPAVSGPRRLEEIFGRERKLSTIPGSSGLGVLRGAGGVTPFHEIRSVQLAESCASRQAESQVD